MAYSIDLRKRVLNFVHNGGSKEKAAKLFQVSMWCVYDWMKRDDLTPKLRPTGHNRKYDWNILAKIVKDNPDLTIIEYSKMIGMSKSATQNALKKMGFTNKKNKKIQ